tara:strand:- start:7893 stop:9719 length:1827 start_codon:yes stop_codon:yes gene_type:complete
MKLTPLQVIGVHSALRLLAHPVGDKLSITEYEAVSLLEYVKEHEGEIDARIINIINGEAHVYPIDLITDTMSLRYWANKYSVPLRPSEIKLPFENWRQHQGEAVAKTLAHKSKFTALTAPTGFGKSGMAVGAIETTGNSALILTKTKYLQRQYDDTFTDIRSVKGRNNFMCHIDGFDHLTVDQALCQTLPMYRCPLKLECAYFVQRDAAAAAPIVISNYDYALAALKAQSTIVTGRSWLVADEAHYLDEQLTSAFSIELTRFQVQRIGSIHKLKKEHALWRAWAKSKLATWTAKLNTVGRTLEGYQRMATQISAYHSITDVIDPDEYAATAKSNKSLQYTVGLLNSIALIDDEFIIRNDGKEATFRPLWVHDQAKKVFDLYDKVILMSATLPEVSTIQRLFSLPDGAIEAIEVPSTFPVENRKVYIRNRGNMSKNSIEQNWPNMMQSINALLDANPKDKTLIHTHNGDIRDRVLKGINEKNRYRIIIHGSGNDREEKIEDFRRAEYPAVMISPSMHSGVDIDSITMQIIVKVPWPDLKDAWVRKRLEVWPEWYTSATIAHMVQCIGRAPRNDYTKARTYILDSNFSRLWKEGRDMFPDYVKEAFIWPN